MVDIKVVETEQEDYFELLIERTILLTAHSSPSDDHKKGNSSDQPPWDPQGGSVSQYTRIDRTSKSW